MRHSKDLSNIYKVSVKFFYIHVVCYNTRYVYILLYFRISQTIHYYKNGSMRSKRQRRSLYGHKHKYMQIIATKTAVTRFRHNVTAAKFELAFTRCRHNLKTVGKLTVKTRSWALMLKTSTYSLRIDQSRSKSIENYLFTMLFQIYTG